MGPEDSRGQDFGDDEDGHTGRVALPPAAVSRTIAGLRLDIVAAETGRPYRLLPDAYNTREAAEKYPTPYKASELARLAAVKIGRSSKGPSAVYLRRCRVKYANLHAKGRAGIKAEMHAESVERTAHRATAAKRKAEAEMREMVEGVRLEAVKATASLSDLFALMKKGLRQQMEAYTEGKPLNGEPVSPTEFQGACRLVTSAVLKMGLPSEDATGTREDVFRELESARESTRAALAMQGEPEGEKPS